MGALTVGSDDDVCIQAKPKQQIAQQNSMVFAVTTTLNIVKIKTLLLKEKLASSAKLLLFLLRANPFYGKE